MAETFQIPLASTTADRKEVPVSDAIAFNHEAITSLALQIHDRSRVQFNNDRLSRKLRDAEESLAPLKNRVAELAGDNRRLLDELKRAGNRVAAMESSTSWRITAPLRWLMRRLTGPS